MNEEEIMFKNKLQTPTLFEKIKLLFVKKEFAFGENVDYVIKKMNNKIYIIKEIIPDYIYKFDSDGNEIK